jgi:hypothetical protein
MTLSNVIFKFVGTVELLLAIYRYAMELVWRTMLQHVSIEFELAFENLLLYSSRS